MKHNFGRKSAPDTRLTCIIGGDIFISPISKRKTTNFWPNAGFAREFQSVVPYTSTQLVSPCARPIFVTAIPFCFNFCFSPWCQINTFCTISLPGTEQCLFFFFYVSLKHLNYDVWFRSAVSDCYLKQSLSCLLLGNAIFLVFLCYWPNSSCFKA
jgi:hypothetical protein